MYLMSETNLRYKIRRFIVLILDGGIVVEIFKDNNYR